MVGRSISLVTWLLVAGSLAIIMGGLAGRPFILAAVPTSSMVPVLRPGDLITIAPLLGRRLEQGQIVVFKTEKDETWIVHRIVGGDQVQGFITRGDANREEDPYRVFPRHVAGVVPELGGQVLKISRLGTLSLGRGPLSNPYIAAVAMFMGIYLLATDQALTWRRSRPSLRRRRKSRTVVEVLSVYLALGLAVSMLTYLSTWSLSSRQEGRVEVVTERYDWNSPKLLLVGEERRETITLENPSHVPLFAGMSASDGAFRWTPGWVYLPPGTTREVSLAVTGLAPGKHQVLLRQSILLPFLPLSWLRALSQLHWHAPAVAVALIPLLLMTGIALTDRRIAGRWRFLWVAGSLRAR